MSARSERPLLRFESVTKTFGALRKPVLENVDLTVMAGESLAILGPSGSGKSTLLNLAGSLEAPDSGRVWFGDQDLAQLGPAELARFRNREIGFVFQRHHLLPQCSALENVLIPTLVNSSTREREAAEQRAGSLLRRVGLGERLTHRPGQLSGGECQRVAVVRALIHSPELLLLDEPTGSLDEASAETLAELFIELNQSEGVALMLVTHSLPLAGRMRRTLELRGGALAGMQSGGAPG